MAEPGTAAPAVAPCLIGRAVAGDQASLAALFQRHAPAVRRAMREQVPARFASVLTVDDLMQDVFIEALGTVRGFHGRSDAAFRAWLLTIATRTLISALRSLEAKKRGGRKSITVCGWNRTDIRARSSHPAMPPVEALDRDEAARALRRAIGSLPERQAWVVQHCDLRDRSVREVADQIGRNAGAVSMLRLRAHTTLRRSLAAFA